MLLLTFGIGALVLVLVELWLLYQDPSGILPLAQAIDAAGGLDGTLLNQAMDDSATGDARQPLPVANFFAWILAIVLLATMGRIAYWAIRAGSGLVALPAPPRQRIPSKDSNPKPEELPEDYRPSHRTAKAQDRTGKRDMPHLYPQR